jgi:hypothetical protein
LNDLEIWKLWKSVEGDIDGDVADVNFHSLQLDIVLESTGVEIWKWDDQRKDPKKDDRSCFVSSDLWKMDQVPFFGLKHRSTIECSDEEQDEIPKARNEILIREMSRIVEVLDTPPLAFSPSGSKPTQNALELCDSKVCRSLIVLII